MLRIPLRIAVLVPSCLLLAASTFADAPYVLLHHWPVERTTSVFVDAAGDVWTTNAERRRVERWDRYGALRSAWDVPATLAGEAPRPSWLAAVAVAPSGDCYVLDAAAHRVIQLDRDGRLVRAWGELGDAPGQLCFPRSLALDRDGNVHVADGWNARVQTFAPDGALRGVRGAPADSVGEGLAHATGVAIDAAGTLWVADHAGGSVVALDARGRTVARLGGSPGGLGAPSHVTLEGDHVIVAGRASRRLEAYGRDGALAATWTDARLGWVDGLHASADGLVYVVSGDRLLVFARPGTVVGGRLVGAHAPPAAAR